MISSCERTYYKRGEYSSLGEKKIKKFLYKNQNMKSNAI